METETRRNTNLSFLDDSDEEALDLFDKLNPESEKAEKPLPSPQEEMSEEGESRQLGRLTKQKQPSKKDKKKQKKREKKLMRLQNMKKLASGILQIATPLKKLKKSKKNRNGQESGNQAARSHDAGSSQFSSGDINQHEVRDQLQNLNPDLSEEEPTPKKRLKKSNRKDRIEQKEGFRVEQLGNDADIDLEKLEKKYEDEDYSFDDVNKKKSKKKLKAKVPTNQQIMSNLREHGGVVESEGEEQPANYDNGLDMLYAMKDKRKGGIKINNKLFCDLEIDIRDEAPQMPPPESLELELKPRTSTPSSSRFSFMSRVETLKKQRGLQSNVDMQDYEKRQQEKAKQSMAKVMSSMIQQDFHDDIELQVRVPTIARGKSADIINNTVFLKSFVRNKSEVPESPIKQSQLKYNKKESVSRQEFYKQIQEQNRLRRSKFISEEELKNSFKKTNLGELEEARKRIQEKRRKQALSEESEQEEFEEMNSQEHKIEELLEKQEMLCGDIQEEEQEDVGNENENEQAEEGKPITQEERKLDEVQFAINIEAQGQPNQQEGEEQEGEEQEDGEQEDINEQNEVIDELASASQHQEMAEEEVDNGEEEQAVEQSENNQEQASPHISKMEVENEIIPEFNEEQKIKRQELEEEGIMLRKRKIGDAQQRQKEVPQSNEPQLNKENQINLPNLEEPTAKDSLKKLAEDQNEEFNNFKKLRKFAMVIAQKKKVREQGRKYAAEFIEQEAEEGSDNEEHDDFIKNIDYNAEDKEYEGVDLDADLVELIDNAVDLNEEDEYEAFRKYLEDIRLKDREEIKKIIRGEFRSKHEDLELEVEEDERKRQERMDEVMNWMKKREEDEGEGIYLKQPEKQEHNSDEDSDFEHSSHKKKGQLEEEDDLIPEEQEKAMIERFIENTLPSSKKDHRQFTMVELGPLPESVRLEKSTCKTISLTRLGSQHSGDAKSTKIKKTSSLVNEILNRHSISRVTQKTLMGKLGRK